MFGFGLKCNVRGCSKFGLNVWQTSGGDITPLFSLTLTDHSLKLGIDMICNSPINMNSRLQRRVFSSNIFKPLIKPIIKLKVVMI